MPGFSRLMGDDDDPSACFALHPSWWTATLPLVVAGRSADDVSAVEAWLDALHYYLAGPAGPAHHFSAPHPLLRQLLAWSVQQAVGGDDADSVQRGLATLTTLVRTAADPVAEL